MAFLLVGIPLHFDTRVDQLQKTAYDAATDLVACRLNIQDVATWVRPCQQAVVDVVHQTRSVDDHRLHSRRPILARLPP